jgi:hypothetical protein
VDRLTPELVDRSVERLSRSRLPPSASYQKLYDPLVYWNLLLALLGESVGAPLWPALTHTTGHGLV